MKKQRIPVLILLAACLVVFVGYRIYDKVITDTVAPVICVEEGQQTLQLSVTDPAQKLLQGVTAEDARDGDVTDSLIIESVGSITKDARAVVTYAAFDSAGNVAKAQRQVEYTDYHSPRFTLSAPLIYSLNSRFDAMDNIGATDVCDGDISYRVRATMLDETTIASEGIHRVLFQVTNSLGDTSEIVAPVVVYASNQYNAGLELTRYIDYIPAGAAFDPYAYPEALNAYGNSICLADGIPEGVELEIAGQVDTNTPGTYTLSYTAKVNRNGALYIGYTNLIVVVEG